MGGRGLDARTTSVIAEEMTQPMAEIEVRSSVQNLRTRAGEFKLAFKWENETRTGFR